ncbi:MAG: hypothetical protein IPG01_07970 [Chitinophagaceae bacterium]|nr:hypothetical protein [Chitinophagaceae bacterium]
MQKDISPLIDFPDTNLEYRKQPIVAFFSLTVPGIESTFSSGYYETG